MLAEVHQSLGISPRYGPERRLEPHPEVAESDLVEIGVNLHGRMVQLDRRVTEPWRRMRDAAAVDGLELVAISGFRSIARQTELIRMKLKAGDAIGDILRTMAAPGFSEHHTGRALDLGSPGHCDLDERFADTAAFRWLQANAKRFGFSLSYPRDNLRGIVYEPWHWCWHPPG